MTTNGDKEKCSFPRRHPRLTATLVGVAGALLILTFAEVVCGSLLWMGRKAGPRGFGGNRTDLVVDDPYLGYRPAPNIEARRKKFGPGGLLYDSLYHIDARGRRVTPVSDGEIREHFALFFGGSFTFGEGVEDGETLPAQFGESAARYRPYNYGYVGYGPQCMLMHLRRPDFRGEIEEPTGIAVYTFIQHHVDRAAGSLRIVSKWGRRLPCVTLAGTELQHWGTFREAWPLRYPLYRLLTVSNTLAYLNFDYPARRRDADFALVAAMLRASQDELAGLFEEVQFYVLFYPFCTEADRLKPLLDRARVKYLDYSALFPDKNGIEGPYTFSDGHPAPLSYDHVAQQLASDLLEEESPS